jgi:dienelactone hydrolase
MPALSRFLITLVLIMGYAACAHAELKTEVVGYKDGDVVLKGYFVWDDAIKGKRPGILVVHEWWGLNDYVKKRAQMLAKLGYVAFAADMYGDGKTTDHADKAREWSTQVRSNVEAWQKRALLGLDILRTNELVDHTRIAAVGYCFGGSTVMELAYAGAVLDGVVSFHGSMPVATPDQASHIRTKILIAHGSADSFIPAEQIAKFEAALDQAHVDWRMVVYGGAHHAFTNPNADDYGIENLRYNKEADQNSWTEMKRFFDSLFKEN